MSQALCRFDPDSMFPGKGGRITGVVAICESCPVIDVCWKYTVSLPKWATAHGVWAGTTPMQRRLELDYARDYNQPPLRLRATSRLTEDRTQSTLQVTEKDMAGAS